VRGRIVAELALVVATGDDGTVDEDNRPNRNVVVRERGPCLLQRERHRGVVFHEVNVQAGTSAPAVET
jgi:hypothetical protein